MPFVYLFRRDQVHKIGHSQNPHQRARQFGVRTEVIHLIETDNPLQVEKALHARFASQHIRGEWFDLTEEDVDLICQVARADAADDLPPALRVAYIPAGRVLVQTSVDLDGQVRLAVDTDDDIRRAIKLRMLKMSTGTSASDVVNEILREALAEEIAEVRAYQSTAPQDAKPRRPRGRPRKKQDDTGSN